MSGCFLQFWCRSIHRVKEIISYFLLLIFSGLCVVLLKFFVGSLLWGLHLLYLFSVFGIFNFGMGLSLPFLSCGPCFLLGFLDFVGFLCWFVGDGAPSWYFLLFVALLWFFFCFFDAF